MKFKFKKQVKKIDKTLLFLVIGLTFFGVLMVYNASAAEALRDFGDKYYYLKFQLLWAVVGLIIMMAVSLVNYKFWLKIAPFVFFINIFLLFLVLIPGFGYQIKGAKRWLNLGFFVFQPAEMIKLSLSLYLSAWLVKKRSFWRFLLLLATVAFLIIIEPDMGTTVLVITTAFFIYYISGASLFYLLPLAAVGFLIGLLLILVSPYRRARLATFLNPDFDPLGRSYHIRQVLIALGSGNLFGVGLGQSRQKYEYLPEATTDSIFAIIAEETGFIGASALVLTLFFVMYRGFRIAKKAPDLFAQLLAGSISFNFGLQTVINLGAMVALIPLTGIPLPFISYGGSSLIVALTSMGILLNISKFSQA